VETTAETAAETKIATAITVTSDPLVISIFCIISPENGVLGLSV
jgi:hypothetical protein